MADYVYTLGMKDAEFRATLRNSEGHVSRSFGRIGSVIDAKTKGVRKFTGALTGIVGVGSGLLSVVGTLTAIVGLVGSIALHAKREAEARERARKEAERTLIALRAQSSGAGSEGAKLRQELFELYQQRRKILKDVAESERADLEQRFLRERDRFIAEKIGKRARESDIAAARLQGPEGERRAEFFEAQQRFQDAANFYSEVFLLLRERGLEVPPALRQYIEAERELLRLTAQRLNQQRDLERHARVFDVASRIGLAEAERLRATGNFEAAEGLERAIEFKRRIFEIERDTTLQVAERARLIQLITQAFEAEKASSRARGEAEGRSLEQELRIMSLRAQGRSDEADAVERRIDLERRMEQIERLRSRRFITDAKARELQEMARTIAGGGGSPRFIDAPLGLTGALRAQALGGSENPQIAATKENATATRENTMATKELTSEMRRIRNQQPIAVYAS